MNMKYGLGFRINIILLALLLFAQLSVYAQDDQRYGQGGNAPVRGTTPTGPHIAGPNIQGPNIQGPNIQGPNIQGPNIQGPNIQGPNIQGPNIQGPNIATPDIPGPLWLSPAQQAMMQHQPANQQPANQPANQQPANQPANQQPANQPANQQPANQQTAGEYIPGEGATVFDEDGVPKFYPPQTFPPTPSSGPTPSPPPPPPSPPAAGPSSSSPPAPSFPSIPPAMGTTGGLVSDICSADNICDDEPNFNTNSDMLREWTMGAGWGYLAGKGDFGQKMDAWLDILERCNFAFQYGFLQGIMASDCDPDVYAELYDKLLERAKAAQVKQELRDRDRFNPCVPSGGGGRGSGGGGSGPC